MLNETQLLTIGLTTVPTMLVVLIGILINNVRLNDTNKRIDDFAAQLNKRIEDLRDHTDRRIGDMRDVLRAEMAKNHSELLVKFTELEHRIDRFEAER